MASRDADGGRAQKSKREGAYFFLVAFFFVAFFTVFFGAVFTAFFFAAFAAIVTLTSLSPFEMPEAAGLARQGQQNDAKPQPTTVLVELTCAGRVSSYSTVLVVIVCFPL